VTWLISFEESRVPVERIWIGFPEFQIDLLHIARKLICYWEHPIHGSLRSVRTITLFVNQYSVL